MIAPGARSEHPRTNATTVAFLRGINVGGHKKISMADLKKAFESLGFKNVRTVLASGNVVFEAPGKDRALADTIAARLENVFGFPVKVVLRSVGELQAIVNADPFKGAPSGPDIKLYVTFLSETKAGRPVRLPPRPSEGLKLVRVTPGEVFSAIRLSAEAGTPDLMAFLERAFGKEVTTRNWQTVLKLVGV
jgi:uncharacterized protein (DUF1697 family)